MDDDALALLQIELVEEIPAFALKELLHVFDDLYFAHLWLSHAEKAPPWQPLPDEYAPTYEETLNISRLEIGTPNLMEFLGLGDELLRVWTYAGGFAGVALGAERLVKVVDGVYGIIQKHLDVRQRRLSLAKELQAAESASRIREERVALDPTQTDVAARAATLGGRISPSAMAHKQSLSKEIQEKATFFVPRYCRDIKICVFRR